MYRMRESWTDERLDDFREEVNRRFDRFEGAVDHRFDKVDRELGRVNDRFDALHHDLYRIGGGGVIVALIGIIVTQL